MSSFTSRQSSHVLRESLDHQEESVEKIAQQKITHEGDDRYSKGLGEGKEDIAKLEAIEEEDTFK